MSKRAMVFIDGSNLYHCVMQTFGRRDLDISKLVAKLAEGTNLVRAYYYTAPLDPAEDPVGAREQQRFFGALSWIDRLEVRYGKLLPRQIEHACPDCGTKHLVRTRVQKGVDTRLSVDLVTLAVRDSYDIGIVVSGDSDFVEAIRFVKEHSRKEIRHAFTLAGWSPELRAIAETKILLGEDFLADCWR